MAGNNEKINTDIVDNASGVIDNCNKSMTEAVESMTKMYLQLVGLYLIAKKKLIRLITNLKNK